MSSGAAERIAAIIPAAGSGSRFGANEPKAFFDLAGLSLLSRSALALSTFAEVIVVAAPSDWLSQAAEQLSNVDAEIHIVNGGETRQDSVHEALKVLPDDIELVLVHDAARPLVTQTVIADVIATLKSGAAAVVPALPVADTVKRVDASGTVVETLDRSTLRRIQTPQGFTRKVLENAFADPTHIATDEAGLVERMGVTVQTVMGSESAFKLTTAEDVQYALSILQETT
ncbi:MAG: 2-C-methyl-D-erythritol 4-phosphate cytidylyltransferase [Actinomycetales bacterium]|nr:2-C-methyl-D-erythritol 4-phosphate cytidylyltransferase [Actinomycetales bacterium]